MKKLFKKITSVALALTLIAGLNGLTANAKFEGTFFCKGCRCKKSCRR